jgi:hypothetical protein
MMKITERMVIVFVLAAVVILAVSSKVFLAEARCSDVKSGHNSCDMSSGHHDPNAVKPGCH